MTIYPHHCRRITTNAVVDVVLNEDQDPPNTEPVTLTEIKQWLRIQSNSAEDALLNELIVEGRKWVEKRCGISVVAKEVTAIIEVMNEQEFPYGPVQNIDSITAVNDQGETVSNYRVVGLDGGYPAVQGYGRFTFTYDAGMDTVPADLKGAIKNYVAFAYENRGDEIDESDEPFAKLARKKSNMFKRTIGF